MMTAERAKWEVEWIPDADAKQYLRAHPDADLFDLCTECAKTRAFPTKGLAMAFANKVKPDDHVGEVRVQEYREQSGHDGLGMYSTWDTHGDAIHV